MQKSANIRKCLGGYLVEFYDAEHGDARDRHWSEVFSSLPLAHGATEAFFVGANVP